MHSSGTERIRRLAAEKSPYLLQHAQNPVDWYPWGEEAFAQAQALGRPVLLSIGYSTCHWCHVMERESFADEEVAAFLNEHFVSIKVDREERPDVDHIYMMACQALTGRGGWPLTVFLTPEKEPFFAGTYFPKRSQQGMMGFLDLLEVVATRWQEDPDKLEEAAQTIRKALEAKREEPGRPDELRGDTLHSVYAYLESQFDSRYGGFGPAPKFPTAHPLLFLMRYGSLTGEEGALAMVEKTLGCMHQGGIYDHLGFGFSRYATDERWLIPHFEKMLYDNALLALAYAECFQITGKAEYERVVREIFTYVLRDMTHAGGGFYAAEDADSEGVEGKFYVWTPAEVHEVLGEEMGRLFCQWYDVTEAGNFEGGYSVINRIDAHRRQLDLPCEQAVWEEKLAGARRRLWEVRETREHPYKDDKILTFWNGLMVAALGRSGWILGDDNYIDAARRGMEFLWEKLRDDQGRWRVRYRDGEQGPRAFLDDYAAVIWACLELYGATHHPSYLARAVAGQEEQDRLFADEESGGYFFTGHDAEVLFTRPKTIHDGATPAGNSLTAWNVLRLSHLTGDGRWAAGYEDLLGAFAPSLTSFPAGSTFFMLSLCMREGQSRQVVIVPGEDWAKKRHCLEPIRRHYSPLTSIIVAQPEFRQQLSQLAPYTAAMEAVGGRTTFYVCRDFACEEPTTSVNDFVELVTAPTRLKD